MINKRYIKIKKKKNKYVCIIFFVTVLLHCSKDHRRVDDIRAHASRALQNLRASDFSVSAVKHIPTRYAKSAFLLFSSLDHAFLCTSLQYIYQAPVRI